MTLRELLSEVLALGFESDGELDGAFVLAANRGLMQIATEIPELTTGRVIANGIHAVTVFETLSYSGEPVSYRIQGKSAAFLASGEGECVIKDGGGERHISFFGAAAGVRVHVNGDAEITFIGDKPYTVADLTVYQTRFGEDEKSIPLPKREAEYPLRELFADYLCASAMPEDRHGSVIEKARIEGETLILPRDYSGTVYLSYKRLPKRMTLDGPDEKIDLAEPLCYLLPLITAAYVWLDNDEDKAAYYMNIYASEARRLGHAMRRGVDSGYKRIGGWA